MSEQGPGVLKRALSRLASSAKEHEAAQLPPDGTSPRCTPVNERCTPVNELRPREVVAVTGTLRTVRLRPRAGVPALVAELYDGSGSLSLVWLGRRQIPGIDPGRRLTCYGRVADDHDQRVIFNPRYELRPAAAE